MKTHRTPHNQLKELRRYLEKIQPERSGSIFTGIYPLTRQQRLDIYLGKKEARRQLVTEILKPMRASS